MRRTNTSSLKPGFPLIPMLLTALLAARPDAASAVPITYTMTGTGSGTLGATLFSHQAITFTLTGDTDDVSGSDGNEINRAVTGQLTIGGLGTTRLTSVAIAMTATDFGGGVILYELTIGDTLGYNAIWSDQFSPFPFDLRQSFGPVTYSSRVGSTSDVFNSDDGYFVPYPPLGNIAWSAILPEPGGLAVFAVGIAGLLWTRKTRCRRRGGLD